MNRWGKEGATHIPFGWDIVNQGKSMPIGVYCKLKCVSSLLQR